MTVEDLKKLLKQVDDEIVITIGVDPLNGEFCLILWSNFDQPTDYIHVTN